jgi:hypothetical protein
VVSVEVGFGLAGVFLELFKSLGVAKVSFSGARKPSVFHTPEPLFVSTP